MPDDVPQLRVGGILVPTPANASRSLLPFLKLFLASERSMNSNRSKTTLTVKVGWKRPTFDAP